HSSPAFSRAAGPSPYAAPAARASSDTLRAPEVLVGVGEVVMFSSFYGSIALPPSSTPLSPLRAAVHVEARVAQRGGRSAAVVRSRAADRRLRAARAAAWRGALRAATRARRRRPRRRPAAFGVRAPRGSRLD